VVYEVRTDVFEGPFDLLLRLITAEEVDVYEVSLARIVDAYVTEVEAMADLDLDVATEFLLIAATLVELKCRRLLPAPEAADAADEALGFEERDLLLSRLVECRTFRGAAEAIERLEDSAGLSVPRSAGPDERFDGLRPDLLAGVGLEDLVAAGRAGLAERQPERVQLDHVLVDELTVAEVVTALGSSLPSMGRISFRRLTAALDNRTQVIVHLLALLELYKLGLLELDQAETFGEIEVEWRGGAEDEGDLRARLVDADYRG
jgi:segregation and condensation protein A